MPHKHVRIAVKRHATKSTNVNIGQWAMIAIIPDPGVIYSFQRLRIIISTLFRQHKLCTKPWNIVVYFPLHTCELNGAGIEEVLTLPSISIPAPMRGNMHVSLNSVNCLLGTSFVVKVMIPGVHTLFSCRVPHHLQSMWVRFKSSILLPRAHDRSIFDASAV